MIKDNLKKYREKNYYSKRYLSKISNVSRNTITAIEFGKTDPKLKTIKKLAKALKVRNEDLIK